MGRAHVKKYSLEQRQIALEAFCLGSPAALQKVRDESENRMAIVAAVKAGEMLKVGGLEAEAASNRRAPGLQIVVIGPGGEQTIAHQPPQMPLLDAVPVPAEPATRPDADAE
jgi:hypothetical protein